MAAFLPSVPTKQEYSVVLTDLQAPLSVPSFKLNLHYFIKKKNPEDLQLASESRKGSPPNCKTKKFNLKDIKLVVTIR